MITFAQSLSDLRAMLGEPTPIYWDDADLSDWLDQGQKDVAAFTLGYQRRSTFTDSDSTVALMAGVREYDIGGTVGSTGLGITDNVAVLHIYLNDQSMPKWTPDMMTQADQRSSGAGTPAFWYQFAGQLGLVPYPDSTFLATTWTMEVVYAAYPTEWTTGESVLPSGFDELPTYAAYVRAMIARRQWSSAWVAYQSLTQMLGEYRQISLARAATPKEAPRQPTLVERVDTPTRMVAGRR